MFISITSIVMNIISSIIIISITFDISIIIIVIDIIIIILVIITSSFSGQNITHQKSQND